MDDGAEIAVRRWGAGRGRRMVISHGNGLAVDGFRGFGLALAQDFDVIAFDLRSHGRSSRGPGATDPWARAVADIPAIFDGIAALYGPAETHGAFHSMSSVCVLVSQCLAPRPWASLTLFEPPLPPSDRTDLREDFDAKQEVMSERAARRRPLFDTPERLYRSLRRAPTFDGVSDQGLAWLARGSLMPSTVDPDQPWELVLPPEVEAQIFAEAGANTRYWDHLATLGLPVQIVTGDPACHDMPNLPQISHHMAQRFGFPIHRVPNTNHFMQLQEPEACADLVRRFIG